MLTNPQPYQAVIAPRPSQAKRSVPRSSKGHFVGQLVYQLRGKPQILSFDSLLEYHAALCLIYMLNVVEVEEQLAPLSFRKPNNSLGTHYFDFRATFRGGKRWAIAVKPERIAQTYKFKATMDAIASAAMPEVAQKVSVITERNLNPIEVHNAKLFHAARKVQTQVDEVIQDALKNILKPMRIFDFLKQVGCNGAGFFSVVRCIRFGHALHVDGGKICSDSLIMSGQVE